MKIPLTPAGIEPATFRFVAQHLNHCATTVPLPTCTPANNHCNKQSIGSAEACFDWYCSLAIYRQEISSIYRQALFCY